MTGPSNYRPDRQAIAELRAAVLYSYAAGCPDLDAIATPWVRWVVTRDDGGMIALVDTLARLVAEGPVEAFMYLISLDSDTFEQAMVDALARVDALKATDGVEVQP